MPRNLYKLCSNKLVALSRNGAHGGAVVEALRYKPEGHRFDSRCYNWIISLT
jgi:hypothetical protein